MNVFHYLPFGILTSVMRSTLLLSFCVFLFSCAGGDVKQDSEVVEMKKSTQYLDVDSDVESDFEKAVGLLEQEKFAQAIEILKSVVEREQRLSAPYTNMGIAYNKIGEKKLAEESLIKALKLDIGNAVANNELGLLYRKAGKFTAARTAYENAIKEHQSYLPAKKNLGVLCDLYMNDYECALEQFEDYLALQPDDKTMMIWAADVKRRLGK